VFHEKGKVTVLGHHNVKMYGGAEVKLRVFLTSAIERGMWLASNSGRLFHGEMNPSVY
jgi:hypothetical protein